MTFRDLVNQDHAVLLLRSAARSKHVSHAYLFVGPPGVGRLETAKAFAQFLNCERPVDGDACGECRACGLIARDQHSDVRLVDVDRGLLLDPDDTTKTFIGIKQVRELRHQVMFPPLEGGWKVYTLMNADRMDPAAGNSLLKVLEEPPPQVVIILIAESTVPMLPTIVSRCQLVRFSLIALPLIEKALIDRHGVAAGQARFLASLSGGQLGRAVTWATSEDALQMRTRVLDLLERLEHADPLDRLDAAEELAKDKDQLPELLDIALFWYRDLLVWKETPDEALLVNLDRKDAIASLAPTVDAAELNSRIAAVSDAKDALRRNVHPRLALEALFMRINPTTQPAPR
jgi:DNA polymerase-3 subunit delta'